MIKMNKIYSLSLACLAVLSFSACSNEEDDLFSSSAAERLNQAKTKYAALLASSNGGWAMEYYATNDSVGSSATDYRAVGYQLCAKFSSDGSVTMGMNNRFSNDTYVSDRSLWDIITDDGPVLSFSTYNDCIHAFCDPNDLPTSIRGGGTSVTGLGAEGDYEFVITDLQDNEEQGTIKGKKRGTYVRMTRLPEGTDFQQYLAECDSFRNVVFGGSRYSEPVLDLGKSSYCIQSLSKAASPKIYPFHGDSILCMLRRPFIVSKRDGNYYLRFKWAFEVGQDSTVQEFVYNPDKQMFTGVGDGNEIYTIHGQDPTTFFSDKVSAGSSWRYMASDQGNSDAYSSLWTAFTSALRSMKYSINGNYFTLTKVDDKLRLNINVRTNRSQQLRLYYLFNYTVDNGNVKLTYDAPEDNLSTTVLNAIPTLKNMLDAVSDTYSVTGASSVFDLTTLRLTSTSSSEKVMNLHLL